MGKTKTAVLGEALPEEKKDSRKDKSTRAPGQKGGERVKVMEGIVPDVSSGSVDSGVKTKKSEPKIRGKKYKEARAKVDKSRLYSLKDAISLMKETSTSKFDGSAELHLVVKKDDLSVQVQLPYSTGKSKKVEIADEKTIEKLKANKVDFDVLLATPDMMPKLVPFARILGPKGMMPNPKNGTIIKDKKDAGKFNADKLTVKTEKKAPVVHVVVGKVSMKEKELTDNIEAILKAVSKRQVLKAYLTSTMGPSVKIEVGA